MIVHIQDSFVSFPSPTYNTSISENLDLTKGPLLLIDLNSTEETMDSNVIYSLSKTSGAGINTNLNYQALQQPGFFRNFCLMEKQNLYTPGWFHFSHVIHNLPTKDVENVYMISSLNISVVHKNVNNVGSLAIGSFVTYWYIQIVGPFHEL